MNPGPTRSDRSPGTEGKLEQLPFSFPRRRSERWGSSGGPIDFTPGVQVKHHIAGASVKSEARQRPEGLRNRFLLLPKENQVDLGDSHMVWPDMDLSHDRKDEASGLESTARNRRRAIRLRFDYGFSDGGTLPRRTSSGPSKDAASGRGTPA